MSLITQSSIDRIKELPILDVVKHYVTDLKKSGTNYLAKSPWTDEKTPSFNVVPAKNIFKCFSTGKGGGPIQFVTEFHGGRLSFPEVVKEIADKCNERLEYEESTVSPEDHKREVEHTEILYKLNMAAARKYTDLLREIITPVTETDDDDDDDDCSSCVRNQDCYLDGTGDTEGCKHPFGLPKITVHPAFAEITKRNYVIDTIIQWQIGYAPGASSEFKPQEWRFLTDLIGDKNYAAAMDLGLIHSKGGHTYDTFRHRIIYPIHNHHGRIVGFGGRTLADTSETPPDGFKPAKYINSSDSAIYKKETVLFGLFFAAEAIRKCGFAYLMEGYTDVISFHQEGYACTVATCGTALTDAQCKLLLRYTRKVVLFRDGDSAGEKAALRDIDLLLKHGFEVAVVPMPKFDDGRKVDPDDLTRMFKVNNTVVVEPPAPAAKKKIKVPKAIVTSKKTPKPKKKKS